MAMTDPIADTLTQIRNALKARKQTVTFPASNVKHAILNVLEEEGYITGHEKAESNGKPMIRVDLKYYQGEPVIDSIKRISKPGRRVYYGTQDLPSVQNGLGVAIVSTSKGIMIERKARESGVGGELICTIS
jgi:small subunit ribosomal protein S8